MILPDPDKSRAILIGVGQYLHLAKLPTVRNNVATLRKILTGPKSWNLPEDHCVAVFDPKTPEELVDPIYLGAQDATDTLLIYYAGHGIRGESRGELRLTRSTSRARASHTSTDYNEVREILLSATALRRIVILDCCYAASALGVMSDPGDSIAEEALIEGTYLIAAAGETQAAMADNGAGFTVFTGELVDLLRNGVPDASQKFLDLDAIFTHLQRSLRAKARPLPHKRVRNSPGSLAISLNKQWVEQTARSVHLPDDPFDIDFPFTSETSERSRVDSWPAVDERTVDKKAASMPAPAPARPGAWPTSAPAVDERTVDKKAASMPAPAPARPGAWPPAAHIRQEEESLTLDTVRNFWPVILEEVKKQRRFAWILLSQNVEIIEFDGRRLLLKFNSENSKKAYRDAKIDKVLEGVVLNKFKLPWVITVASESARGGSVQRGSGASNSRRVGQWPVATPDVSVPRTGGDGSVNAKGGEDSGAQNVRGWPPVARFDPVNKLSKLAEWPTILEEVRNRRRYAWLVLSHHANVTSFDDESIELQFENYSAQSNYHHSGVHELLEAVLRDKFGRKYTVNSGTKPSG